MSFLLDIISTVDLFSDFYVIHAFIYSRHAFWMCISMTTIMMPFFVAQVPYLNFKLEQYKRKSKDGKKEYRRKFVGVLLLTPLLLLYFLVTDVFYLFFSILLAPFMLIISIFNPNSTVIHQINDVLTSMFKTLFGL